MNKKMRVKVWAGAQEQELGLGTLEGYVTVFFVQMPGGAWAPVPDAETRPTAAEVAAINPRGGTVVAWPGNPKIRLDSGPVVYGCLVHWAPVQ